MFSFKALTLLALPILVQADGFHAFGTYAGCTSANRVPADKVKYTSTKVKSPHWCGGYCTSTGKTWSYYRYSDATCYCSDTGISGTAIQKASDGKGNCARYQFNADITVGLYEFSDCFSGYNSGGAVTTTTQTDLDACLLHCASPTVAYIPLSGKCTCPGLLQTLSGNGGVKTCTGSTTYLYTQTTSAELLDVRGLVKDEASE